MLLQSENFKNEISEKIVFDKEWLGLVDFQKSLNRQEELKHSVKSGKFCFLGFEPKNSIITKGLRSVSEDILWSKEQLKKHYIEQLELQRGGQATLHTLGQLVLYPVVSLPLLGIKMKNFILALESITQSLFLDMGVSTKRLEKYSGLSTSVGKIAFFGIHISEGVSQHGLSINVFNDLNLFSSIKSCGLSHRIHDSLFCQGIDITPKELFYKWVKKAELFFINEIE